MPEYLLEMTTEEQNDFFECLNNEILTVWSEIKDKRKSDKRKFEEVTLLTVASDILNKYGFDFEKIDSFKSRLRRHIYRELAKEYSKNGLTEKENQIIEHLLLMQEKKIKVFTLVSETIKLLKEKRTIIEKKYSLDFGFFGF